MILEITKKLLKDINANGISINKTTEIQNALINIKMKNIDLAKEEIEIRNYYDEVLGENFTARMKIEQDHYLFLEYALKHKISEIQYFNKGEDITSRKYIVFSGDCINCINLLVRPEKNIMNVFMRSSDCLRLLPIDIFNTIKILYNVLNRHGENKKEFDEVNFFITSLHYYDRDKKLAEDIIKDD